MLEYQQCVADAVMDILKATCGVQLQPQQEDEQAGSDGVIIAVISLVGDVEWSIFLGLPRETVPVLVAKFAGFEIPFDSEDMGDAVGELANILAGDVKRRLEAKGARRASRCWFSAAPTRSRRVSPRRSARCGRA